MKPRKTFVAYTEWREEIQKLPSDEHKYAIYDAIFCFCSGQEPSFPEPWQEAYFDHFRKTLERDADTYDRKVETLRANAKKGGRPRKDAAENQKKPNGFPENQKVSVENQEKPDETKSGCEEPHNTKYNSSSSVEEEEKKKKDKNTYCAELKPSAPPSAPPTAVSSTPEAAEKPNQKPNETKENQLVSVEKSLVFARFPAVGGEFFEVTHEAISHYMALYPAVDVLAELRKMQGWLESNPKNVKTLRGMPRFINAWLARAQDKAPAQAGGPAEIRPPRTEWELKRAQERAAVNYVSEMLARQNSTDVEFSEIKND